MWSLASTNSATVSLQSTLNRSRIEQARREADRAEAKAQSLRSEADAQERIAQQGQERVRALAAGQSRTSDATYASAVKGRSKVPEATQDFMARLYKASAQSSAANGNALKDPIDANPVLNGVGQFTGRIVNLQV
jgi:hypothetical protein